MLEPDRGSQRANLGRGERAASADGLGADLQWTDGDADELEDFGADRFDHPPNLTVGAFEIVISNTVRPPGSRNRVTRAGRVGPSSSVTPWRSASRLASSIRSEALTR